MARAEHHAVTVSGTVLWLFAEAAFAHLMYIEEKLEQIMAAVQIGQADLDSVGDSLEALVTTLNGIDLTPLPAADQTKLVQGLTDVTAATNKLADSVNVPAPNPDPGPTA